MEWKETTLKGVIITLLSFFGACVMFIPPWSLTEGMIVWGVVVCGLLFIILKLTMFSSNIPEKDEEALLMVGGINAIMINFGGYLILLLYLGIPVYI